VASGLAGAGDGAAMAKEQNGGCGDPECGCGGGDACGGETDEMEVVELEDENGDMEEFAILDELDFEGRHFVIMAPFAEAQKLRGLEGGGQGPGDGEYDLSIEIFECDGDDYTEVEDEDLARRLIQHLSELEEQEG
jgi:hypothetical protein